MSYRDSGGEDRRERTFARDRAGNAELAAAIPVSAWKKSVPRPRAESRGTYPNAGVSV
jgi:hypothetical protein